MSSETTVLVCRKCKAHRKLLRGLEEQDGVRVEEVRCQGICKGAVAGVEVDGTMTWLRRVRGGKDVRAVAKLARRADTGPVPKRLRDHVVTRRLGRRPKR